MSKYFKKFAATHFLVAVLAVLLVFGLVKFLIGPNTFSYSSRCGSDKSSANFSITFPGKWSLTQIKENKGHNTDYEFTDGNSNFSVACGLNGMGGFGGGCPGFHKDFVISGQSQDVCFVPKAKFFLGGIESNDETVGFEFTSNITDENILRGIVKSFKFSEITQQINMAGWTKYIDPKYSFEVMLPPSAPGYEKPHGISEPGTVTVNGRVYQKVSVTIGSLTDIQIIKSWSKPNVNPFQPEKFSTKQTINGIDWYVFYEPKGGVPQCDMTTFQTLTRDGKDTIAIDYMDETKCPGDEVGRPSQIFLKQVISTFKFTQ